jgi:DHA2 family methylenomycin A resistance protein-like MFS transporter
VVSTTVVSVALPAIGGDLHLGPTGLEWVVDAYVLVSRALWVSGLALLAAAALAALLLRRFHNPR